jgi:hypothetical protein
MIPSYYILKGPYCLLWRLAGRLGRRPAAAAFCAVPMDVALLMPVLKHLPAMPVVVKNRRTARYARSLGLSVRFWPVFPDAVIMCRHAVHLFPCESIVRIGFRHGAYTFKSFTGAKYYNAFDAYFLTGREELERSRAHGIRSARAAGFPKLDPAFDGTWTPERLEAFRRRLGLDPDKPTVIFSATWDRSGMSAVDRWIPALPGLAGRYNLLATVHPWTSGRYIRALRRTKGVRFVEDPDTLPCLLLADVLVGDSSSIIAEFCGLDKPIVTFRVPASRRSVPHVREMLDRISLRIDKAEELPAAIAAALENPGERREARREASRHMFDSLDGKAGLRAAETILEMLPGLRDLKSPL